MFVKVNQEERNSERERERDDRAESATVFERPVRPDGRINSPSLTLSISSSHSSHKWAAQPHTTGRRNAHTRRHAHTNSRIFTLTHTQSFSHKERIYYFIIIIVVLLLCKGVNQWGLTIKSMNGSVEIRETRKERPTNHQQQHF